MQERRTTVRIAYRHAAQYCPVEDPLPRDGRLTDLSERGVGMQVREAHSAGERITVSFPLPGDSEPATATGIVRWCADQPGPGGWRSLGMEWLPLEEGARNRLHRFFSTHASQPAAGQAPQAATRLSLGTLAIALAAAGVSLVLAWQTSTRLTGEKQLLGQAVQQRDWVIGLLNRREQGLRTELSGTQQLLTETSLDVQRLNTDVRSLTDNLTRVGRVLTQTEATLADASADREALVNRVIDLEQERMILARRLVSTHQVRTIVKEMIEQRQAAAVALQPVVPGNEGYVIREGRPTIGRGTVWIQVHQPEADAPAVPVATAPAESAVAVP